MDNQFKQYQLKPFVIAGLDAMGITQPTPIQKKGDPGVAAWREPGRSKPDW